MIKWRDHFDFVAVICTPSREQCLESLKTELGRVGLVPDIYQFGVPTKYEEAVCRLTNVHRYMRNAKSLNSTLGHFLAIETAVRLNKRRLLVIEDDIRFLSDMRILDNVVESIPNVDIVQFDSFPFCPGSLFFESERYPLFPKWIVNRDFDVASFGCLALNQRAMNFFCEIKEGAAREWSQFCLIDRYLYRDFMRGHKISSAFPVPLAARQIEFAGVTPNSNSLRGSGSSGIMFEKCYRHAMAYRNGMYG